MSIRSAGMRTRIATDDEMSSYQFVSQWSDEVLKKLAKKLIRKNVTRLLKILSKENNAAKANEIKNALEKNFLNINNNKEATNATIKYLKDLGFSDEDANQAESYASLFRIKEGMYDEEFTGIVSHFANRLMGMSKALHLNSTDAMSDIMTMITTGNYSNQQKEVDRKQKKTVKKFGMGIERYLTSIMGLNKIPKAGEFNKTGIPGAGAFKAGMEEIAKNITENITDKGWQKSKKENEKTVESTGGETDTGESDTQETNLGDVEPDEYGEAELHDINEEASPFDKKINQNFESEIKQHNCILQIFPFCLKLPYP